MDLESLETIAVLNAENEHLIRNEEGGTQGVQSQIQEVESETQVTQTVFHSNKRLKASVWKEFIPVELEVDGKKRGRCIHCNKKLVIETSQGTSALKRHLKCCPKRPPDLKEERLYDPRVDRSMISEIIIYHDLPFQYAEYQKVRDKDKYLNPDCQHVCRQTVGADVYRRYELEKEKLKKLFVEHQGRVCFTADMWTTRSIVMGYICLTTHFVDDSWRLNNKILAFCDMKPPHTGEELASKILTCLKEWGLEKKVFSLTLDNATNNDSMQRILIVKEGLELANALLENIRDSVKFVKASESRKDSFAACVESVGIKSGYGLSLDVPTCWNSTYDMLARALKFHKAFASLKECDRSYKSLPSEDEWDRGEKICDLLKPFSTITTYFSGVKYPTANVYFIQVWKIELLLRKYSRCGDANVEEVAKRMELYWDEYSVVLAMGAVLDPRFKLQILKSAYDKVDPNTSHEKIEVVKDNLKLLYEEYQTKSRVSSSSFSATTTPHEILTESPLEDDLNFDIFELEKSSQPGLDNVKSNLDIYLEEPRLDSRSFADIEVLSFWKNNGQRYGDLAFLARDLLSIPITTVASESAFNIGGRVLNPYRNRLLPKNVQALICTRNWLCGFAELEGDIEENFCDGNEDATNTATSSGI